MNEDVIVTIRLTALEYTQLKHRADQENLGVNEFIRQFCGGYKKANRLFRWSRDGVKTAKLISQKCAGCGSVDKLDVHHIDGSGPHKTGSPNNNLDNLVVLCHKCHMRSHFGVSYKYEDIAGRRANGETFQSIADSYGLSRQRVHQILKVAGDK
jgi:hypothetical protein